MAGATFTAPIWLGSTRPSMHTDHGSVFMDHRVKPGDDDRDLVLGDTRALFYAPFPRAGEGGILWRG